MTDDTFEARHAQVDPDPLKELKRRRQMWASAPDSRGVPLKAAIVPNATIDAAIEELRYWRERQPLRAILRQWWRKLDKVF